MERNYMYLDRREVMLEISCNVMHAFVGDRTTIWKTGWVMLHSKYGEIYCDVFYGANVRTRQRYNSYKIRYDIKIVPKSIGTLKNSPHLNFTTGSKITAVKPNSSTETGALLKLFQFLCNLKEKGSRRILKEFFNVNPPSKSKQISTTLTSGIVTEGSSVVAPPAAINYPRIGEQAKMALKQRDLISDNVVQKKVINRQQSINAVRKTPLDKVKILNSFGITPDKPGRTEENRVSKASTPATEKSSVGGKITEDGDALCSTPSKLRESLHVGLFSERRQVDSATPISRPTVRRSLSDAIELQKLIEKDETPAQTLGEKSEVNLTACDKPDNISELTKLYSVESNKTPLKTPVEKSKVRLRNVESFYSRRNYSRTPLMTLNTNSLPSTGSRSSQKRSYLHLHDEVSESKRQKTTSVSPKLISDKLENGFSRSYLPSPKRLFVPKDTSCEAAWRVGFVNLGNSCFMNSVLQCLLHLNCFVEDLCSAFRAIEYKLPNRSITRCLTSLMSAAQNEKEVSEELRHVLEMVCSYSNSLNETDQHDAQELLLEIFRRISEESEKVERDHGIKVGKMDSIKSNFLFELSNSYQCESCKKAFKTKDHQVMLSLHVPSNENKSSSLFASLRTYFSSQTLEFSCTSCKETKAKFQPKFSSVPRVLVLHLKRYLYQEHSVKLHTPMEIPTVIHLEKYVDGTPCVNFPSRRNLDRTTYDPVRSPLKSMSSCRPKTPSLHGGRFSFLNRGNCIGMKGGKGVDDGSDVVAETINNEPEMTEEEQITLALEKSLQDIRYDEDRAVQEALNISREETQKNNAVSHFEEESMEVESLVSIESDQENESQLYGYQLASIVSHRGPTPNGGHYVASIYDSKTAKWFEFNDSVVSEISREEVLRVSKREGYLFFYISRDVLDAP